MDKAAKFLEKDAPEVLKNAVSIILPDFYNTSYEVIATEYEDISNINLIPSKGNMYRNVSQSSVALQKGDVYNENAFFLWRIGGIRRSLYLERL